MNIKTLISLLLFTVLNVSVCTVKAESLTVSINTNVSSYIAADPQQLAINILNSSATPIPVDIYIAIMLTDQSLQFVQYDLLNNTSTLSAPVALNDRDNWIPAVNNITLPANLNLQNFNVLNHIVSETDPLGQYTWYIGITTPGTKNFISNIASSSHLIDSIANMLVGSWSGSWDDTVFDVQGTTDLLIDRVSRQVNVSGSINLQSIFMPDAHGTATAEITDNIGNRLTFPFGSALLGNGNGTINRRKFSGTGTIIPSIGFGAFTFEGNFINDNTIQGIFTYTDVGAGAGTFLMSKD